MLYPVLSPLCVSTSLMCYQSYEFAIIPNIKLEAESERGKGKLPISM